MKVWIIIFKHEKNVSHFSVSLHTDVQWIKLEIYLRAITMYWWEFWKKYSSYNWINCVLSCCHELIKSMITTVFWGTLDCYFCFTEHRYIKTHLCKKNRMYDALNFNDCALQVCRVILHHVEYQMQEYFFISKCDNAERSQIKYHLLWPVDYQWVLVP